MIQAIYVIVVNACQGRCYRLKNLQIKFTDTIPDIRRPKEVNFKTLMIKHPTYAVEYAVKGMLPKNSLGRAMFKKLKVFAGPEHNHAAQKPEIYEF